MKKVISLCVIALVLVACGPSKTVKESKKTLKGNWVLNDIDYSKEGIYNVQLFQDTSAECLVGSTWRFIPNNNFGNYDVMGANCTTGKRYFVWTIPDGGENATNYDIILKPTDEKMNSTMNDNGFRLNIGYLSEDQLQITQTVRVDGNPFTITMNFNKAVE